MDITEMYRARQRNYIVTTAQLEQDRIQRNLLLDSQVQQSVTSHKQHDSKPNNDGGPSSPDTRSPIIANTHIRDAIDVANTKARLFNETFANQLETDLRDKNILQESSLARMLLMLKYSERYIRQGNDTLLRVTLQQMHQMRAHIHQMPADIQARKFIAEKLDYYISYYDGMLTMSESAVQPGIPLEFIDARKTEPTPTKKLQEKINNHKLQIGTTADKYKHAPLFPARPQIQDVQQGHVGDCFLMASIASLIQSDPEQLMKSMRDNGDNTVTVRFFRKRKKKDYLWEQNKTIFKLSEPQVDAAYYASMPQSEKLEFLIKTVLYSETASGAGSFSDTLKKDLPPQWATIQYDSKSLCEHLIQDANLHDILKESVPMEEALHQLYLKDPVIINRSLTAYIAQARAAGVTNLDANNQSYMQEIYVMVTKDLPEEIFSEDGQQKAREIYARGPLWVRLLEKAYAASGLNQERKEKDSKQKPLADMERSYQGICGGSTSCTLEHLTGKPNHSKAIFKTYKEHKNTLTEAMKRHFGESWIDTISSRFHLTKSQADALKQALEQEDASQQKSATEKDENDMDIITYYRRQAAGLDDLIRVILTSNIPFASGDANEQRRELALLLVGELSTDKKCQLQFARFSGQYTKNAMDKLRKIKNALAQGKPIGAGSTSFIPKSVQKGGLNDEPVDGGIAQRHAYSILGTRTIGKNEFIVLRNPWAKKPNMYHRQPDGSVTDEMDRSVDTNGVFLMELNDFVRKFKKLHGV